MQKFTSLKLAAKAEICILIQKRDGKNVHPKIAAWLHENFVKK